MSSKTKTKILPQRRVPRLTSSAGYQNYELLPASTDTIVYDDGPKYAKGHLLWKECSHTWNSVHTSDFASASWESGNDHWVGTQRMFRSSIPLPKGDWDPGVLDDCMNQLDLNVHDSVLAYSGIIQAIPMVGGLFKFNRIMRDVASHITKGMRRKPFTTVVKSLISLDFIDRFVIGPTLDDARKVADATNYVVRVIQTAHERNSAPVALKSSRVSGHSDTSSISTNLAGTTFKCEGRQITSTTITSQAMLLVEASYDVNAISPLALLAARTGITRPLDSVWDLIPFSFVVDYFSKAGDFISALSDEMSRQNALSAKIGRIYGAWGTVKVETKYSATCERIIPPSSSKVKVLGMTPGTETMSSGRFSRFQVPTWRLFGSLQAFPSLGLDLSLRKFGTLAELVAQAKL